MNTVIGNKIVCYGVTLIWKVTGLKEFRGKDYFKELIQKLPDKGAAVYVGPPYSYNNTLMSYLIIQPSSQKAFSIMLEAHEAIKIHGISILQRSRCFYVFFIMVLRFLNHFPRINAAAAKLLRLG